MGTPFEKCYDATAPDIPGTVSCDMENDRHTSDNFFCLRKPDSALQAGRVEPHVGTKDIRRNTGRPLALP